MSSFKKTSDLEHIEHIKLLTLEVLQDNVDNFSEADKSFFLLAMQNKIEKIEKREKTMSSLKGIASQIKVLTRELSNRQDLIIAENYLSSALSDFFDQEPSFEDIQKAKTILFETKILIEKLWHIENNKKTS